jgi:hypothetical protein
VNALEEAIRTLRPSPGDRHGPLMPLLVLLTCLTGVVDAVSYLKFGHVFVANMTGNLVFLGFALAGAGGLSAITSLVAIGSFVMGAALSGYLGGRNADHRGRLLRAACVVQFALILAATIVAVAVGEPLNSGSRYALLVPLALAMGVQNAAAQRLAVPELTTTVLTRTITGLASEAGFLGGPGAKAGRRLLASRRCCSGPSPVRCSCSESRSRRRWRSPPRSCSRSGSRPTWCHSRRRRGSNRDTLAERNLAPPRLTAAVQRGAIACVTVSP